MENKALQLNQASLRNSMASCMVETASQVASLNVTTFIRTSPPGHKAMGECVRDSVLSQAENSCSIGLDSRLSNHDHSRSSLLYLLTDHLCNPINISSITSLRNPGHIFFIFNLGS